VDRLALLERAAEIAAITEFLSTPHHQPLMVIEGPAGIGKTRLIRQARRATGAEGLVLSARGSDLERDFAFGVVRQLFEPYLAALGPAERNEVLAGTAHGAKALFGTEFWQPAQGPGGLVQDASFAILHGLYWLALNLAAVQPVLVTIDDLHWADAPSLRWLAYVIPRLEGVDLKIVVTHRSGALDVPAGLRHVVLESSAVVLRPAPLSRSGTATMLSDALGGKVDSAFVEACHTQTGGIPLYLCELVRAVVLEAGAPTTPAAADLNRLAELAGRAASRTVSARLATLPKEAVRVATAIALLGDGPDVRHVAAVAGLRQEETARAMTQLMGVDILQQTTHATFVHPMIRAAVAAQIGAAERSVAHATAARLLIADHAEPERTAAHLLPAPPGIPAAVGVLRAAARQAQAKGAPGTAVAYLDRCLSEPIQPEERAEILADAGSAARMIDLSGAIDRLRAAVSMTTNPQRQAQITWTLVSALQLAGRSHEAVDTCKAVIGDLADDDADLRLRLQASLALVPVFEPNRHDLLAVIPELRRLPPSGSYGGRCVDAVIARHDALAGDPGAVAYARRALAGTIVTDGMASLCWHVLILAEVQDALVILDEALAEIHRTGDVTALVAAYTLRALAWLERGQLQDAEADAREAAQAEQLAGVPLGQFFTDIVLAQILMERGRLAEAAIALRRAAPDPVPPVGPMYHVLDARAQLLRLQGQHEQAWMIAMECGGRYAAHGGQNPAFVRWRSGAALSLHALGRTAQARQHAEDELALARRWGAPGTLGRALRVAGVLADGAAAESRIEEAVAVLERSSAQLEYARALADLGSLLRRSGRRTAARDPLRRALDLALVCGADPLTKYVTTELIAAGVRPRRTGVIGPDALTASERRVAEMAAAKATNREIAQALSVTPKTIEVHLGNVYRKLGITSRIDLPGALAGGRP